MYLIPSRAIAGRVGILLRTYRKYIVGNARGLLGMSILQALRCAPRRDWVGRAEMISAEMYYGDALEGASVADVEEWLARVGEALGVPVAEVLPKDLRREMLDLTGDIAHNVVRVAVPWSSYLMGVAVGRGASPEEALRLVRELLPPRRLRAISSEK